MHLKSQQPHLWCTQSASGSSYTTLTAKVLPCCLEHISTVHLTLPQSILRRQAVVLPLSTTALSGCGLAGGEGGGGRVQGRGGFWGRVVWEPSFGGARACTHQADKGERGTQGGMTTTLLLSRKHEPAVPWQTCIHVVILKFRAEQALLAHRRFVTGTNMARIHPCVCKESTLVSESRIPLCLIGKHLVSNR